MLKLFRQLALRCLVFSLLAIALTFSNLAFGNLSFSNPLFAQVTPSPDGPNPPSTELKSDVKGATTIKLDERSGVAETEKEIVREPATKVKSPEPQDEYDMNAIHEFDRELYGD
jgi:hypothetical protein